METQTTPRLSDNDVMQLDPYTFMALVGKKVIHPGGRRATEELYGFADFQPGQQVLDVGAGVGTTAIEIANRFGCRVTAVDIDPIMLARAGANVRAAGLDGQVTVAQGDIQSLPFPADSFDTVIIEAVLMFVDQPAAAREVARVCRPGGRVVDHEFIYTKPPTDQVRSCFLEVCPCTDFESVDTWTKLYSGAGFSDIRHVTGPFVMMTPAGMLRDEGIGNLMRMMGRVMSRPAHVRKMRWMMARMMSIKPSLGYVVLAGTSPPAPKRSA
jgi:ubiquinone/menaquinone biosynthesis C-methylase UbiE